MFFFGYRTKLSAVGETIANNNDGEVGEVLGCRVMQVTVASGVFSYANK